MSEQVRDEIVAAYREALDPRDVVEDALAEIEDDIHATREEVMSTGDPDTAARLVELFDRVAYLAEDFDPARAIDARRAAAGMRRAWKL